MAVGTCFGCGARKPALAALLVRERHERLALCQDCLRDAPGGLARLSRRLRAYLTERYGPEVAVEVSCAASLPGLTILLATCRRWHWPTAAPERRRTARLPPRQCVEVGGRATDPRPPTDHRRHQPVAHHHHMGVAVAPHRQQPVALFDQAQVGPGQPHA